MTEPDAGQTAQAVRSREASAVEIARHFLDRIARDDGHIGAFLRVDREGALAQAQTVDARIEGARRERVACPLRRARLASRP